MNTARSVSESGGDGGRGRTRPTVLGRRSIRLLLGLVVAAVPFVVAVPSAFAGVGLGVSPNFPSPVAVGATGVAASVTITNLSTSPESTGNVTLNSIHLVPSCGKITANTNCPAAGADPGVFQVVTATGASGTACAGDTFTITVSDATTGQLKLTPSSPVVLGPPSSATQTCVINLVLNVVKDPKFDVAPAAGLQTEQIATATGTHTDGTKGTGTGSSVVTVTDTAAPSCVLTGSIVGPPAQIQVTVQDSGSGLAAGGIVVTQQTNATVNVPTFTTGTTGAVVVTATKVDQTMSSQLGLQITDRAGNVTNCDPTSVTLHPVSAATVSQTATGVSRSEHFLTVFNSRLGVHTLIVKVNGQPFVLHLTNGETVTINVAKAMKAGSNNTVEFTSSGPAGSSATAVLHT